MKACKKWINRHRPTQSTEHEDQLIEMGWRAALVWALQEVLSQDEDGVPRTSVNVAWVRNEDLNKCYIPVERIIEELDS